MTTLVPLRSVPDPAEPHPLAVDRYAPISITNSDMPYTGRPSPVAGRLAFHATVTCYSCKGSIEYTAVERDTGAAPLDHGRVLLMAEAEGWQFTAPGVPFPRAFCTTCKALPDPAARRARPYVLAAAGRAA